MSNVGVVQHSICYIWLRDALLPLRSISNIYYYWSSTVLNTLWIVHRFNVYVCNMQVLCNIWYNTHFKFNDIAYQHFNQFSILSMWVLTFKLFWIPSRIMPDTGQNMKMRTYILFLNGWRVLGHWYKLELKKTQWIYEHSLYINI